MAAPRDYSVSSRDQYSTEQLYQTVFFGSANMIIYLIGSRDIVHHNVFGWLLLVVVASHETAMHLHGTKVEASIEVNV